MVEAEAERPTCGIVMPLSELNDYSAAHWIDVQDILTEAIDDAGFEASLVSDAEDIGVIHKRTIQNLYDNPIVVCDVSGKNPNVMFELGLRLAFDKPTIIVKDNATAYSFDTAPIEHLDYPRDLRYTRIIEFKEKLSEKIKATHGAATSNPSYSAFLKNFGEFTVAKLTKKEVSGQEYLLEEIQSLRVAVERISNQSALQGQVRPSPRRLAPVIRKGNLNACMRGLPLEKIEEAAGKVKDFPGITGAKIVERSRGHYHIQAQSAEDVDLAPLKQLLVRDYPL